MELGKYAKLIRSKNAGPFHLTFDIMFDSEKNYHKVSNSGVITKKLISGLFSLPEEQVDLYDFPAAWAIKFTIPRPYIQGDLHDTDCFGGQQYGPLVKLEVPE